MSNLISPFEIAVSIAAAVILFVYALRGFSKDVREAGGERLSLWLGQVTKSPAKAFALGAALTALVQSSSAISGITVALVESGTILFRSSLPVFLGANVGTTSTAWLVSLNLSSLGPILIVISLPISWLSGRISLAARSVFYLGVILLALQLVSDAIAPVKSDPALAQWLAYAKSPGVGLLIGIVGTALLQSSSVMVGLAIIAVQQGLLSAEHVIPVVIGSNLGTTSTALIASLDMGVVAKRAAVANLMFNALGVLAFLPIMTSFAAFVIARTPSGDTAVAIVHLIFNIVVALLGALVLNRLADWLSAKVR
jgi:phosphate:Na+ symporter